MLELSSDSEARKRARFRRAPVVSTQQAASTTAFPCPPMSPKTRFLRHPGDDVQHAQGPGTFSLIDHFGAQVPAELAMPRRSEHRTTGWRALHRCMGLSSRATYTLP